MCVELINILPSEALLNLQICDEDSPHLLLNIHLSRAFTFNEQTKAIISLTLNRFQSKSLFFNFSQTF